MVGKDRWHILNTILQEMDIKKEASPKQHWMIIGPRGIGKSHLTTLLYHKVKDNKKLSRKWIPVLFPEELKRESTLTKFLERTLNEIILEYEKTPAKYSITQELRQKIKEVKEAPIPERADNFFSLITWFYRETGKHILLLTENLQQLLGKRFQLIEQKKLRAFLQTSDAVLIIGTATTVFNALHDHSHPFYHFFHVRRLKDLEFEDMKTLITNILFQKEKNGIKIDLTNGYPRLKALHSFAGGNPRMAVFLADILSTEVPGEMIEIMDRTLDELTPYFQSISEGIPNHLEEVLNTLAAFEPAQSPAEIAQYIEIPQATTRKYLKQLKDDGFVRIAFSKGKSNYYCLNEYLYRTWFQMRDSSHREETRWLLELLLLVYSKEELLQEKNRLDEFKSRDKMAFLYKKLIEQAVEFIDRHPEYCKVIESCIESLITAEKTETELDQKETEMMGKVISYLINQRYDKAIKICEEIKKKHPGITIIYKLFFFTFFRDGWQEEASKKFQKIIKQNPNSELAYFWWGEYLKAQGIYEEAIEKYRKVIELDPKSEDAYLAWGDCLKKQEKYEKSIEKYQKVLELNPESGKAYFEWGVCLEQQEKFEEAIELYENHIKDIKDITLISLKPKGLKKACRHDYGLNKFEDDIQVEEAASLVYFSYGQLLERKNNKKGALIAYLNHFRHTIGNFISNFDFPEKYNQHIVSLVSQLKPRQCINHFFKSEKEKFADLKPAILLILLGQYDIIHGLVQDIIDVYLEKDAEEKNEFELFIFAIKLSSWLKLIEAKMSDALKAIKLYLDYVKSLKTSKKKENEVLHFSLNLFRIQLKFNLDAENIQKALNRIEEEEEVPFSDVIFKVWTCLSYPDSLEAQRYLNEKAVAEVVNSFKQLFDKAEKGVILNLRSTTVQNSKIQIKNGSLPARER